VEDLLYCQKEHFVLAKPATYQFTVFCSVAAFLVQGFVHAEDVYKKSQFYRGITSHYAITDTIEADVDGDGSNEFLICYKEPESAVNQQGGVLILTGEPRHFKVLWHAMFEEVFPSKVSASGKALTFHLVHKKAGATKEFERTLVADKDIFFRDSEKSPFANVKITASSTLKEEGISPDNVFDRNLKTSWAEGAKGTGIDESITMDFSKPVDIAMIGVLHGNFKGKRYWLDNNRLHRAEVTLETQSDKYDADSDVDFSEDLGLGLYGDRIELRFSNRPVMRYFKIEKKSVVSLELQITSVLLGEKNDDTYIAEIDLVELIPQWLVLGKPKPKKEKTNDKKKVDSETDANDWTEDDF